MQTLDLSKYRGIATSLAAVCLASKSYSIIDRVANALSIDSVSRAIYENARILENLVRSYIESNGAQGIHEEKREDGLTVVRVIPKKGETPYMVNGYLANEEQIRVFLEDTAKDIRLARSVASYAMSMVAASLSQQSQSAQQSKSESSS